MMAPRRNEMLLSMSLVVALWGVTVAQSQSSCTNEFISLYPCLDYLTGKTSTPSSGCCLQLSFVVKSQPQCLCEVVNGGESSVAASLNINQTRALSLPNACRVQTPPISTCSRYASSPTSVPVSNIPYSPSGIGSNTVSSTTGGRGSGAYANSSSTKLPCSLLVLFLFSTTLIFTLMTTT
ncbi:non-specific lipid transfer protein GPI-anchored 5 [Gastrolobium bilobum]|uniref:non-specific lipid transfer protein GPI-anchored 5 n=1 Tax=Gastrolobium bilobum TaxID=150636 RepID=UPI002AB24E02|nr:non-specific lipid transfer protein GPI-anchored 5 [Gastrolobium bilobum]